MFTRRYGFCKNAMMEQPKKRSALRAQLGHIYYGILRRILWIRHAKHFAKEFAAPLPQVQYTHKTPLLRKLRNVDMQYQYNKIINLKIAVQKLNGIVLHPGEVFSYWRLIGKPTARRGYVDGMVLCGGNFGYAVGGGLCQLSNLIFWMTLHTPLTVTERHRHGFDVFPDSNRTQPFGSGATCFYPHGDLMICNNTDHDFQLTVRVGENYLHGAWRADAPPAFRYEVVEKNHAFKSEYWGGYSRHNELYRRIFDAEGNYITEEFLLENHALTMYSPLLPENGS